MKALIVLLSDILYVDNAVSSTSSDITRTRQHVPLGEKKNEVASVVDVRCCCSATISFFPSDLKDVYFNVIIHPRDSKMVQNILFHSWRLSQHEIFKLLLQRI